MNFSDALASSIHDIKNSLSTLLIALEEILNEPGIQSSKPHLVNVVRKEAQRANNNLIQLLSIYKLDGNQLDANLDEHNLEDFLDEIVAENSALATALEQDLCNDCDPLSSGYFDENLVRGVLNHAVGNAQRYTRERIRLSAAQENGWTVFRIQDDGEGFPPEMLIDPRHQDKGNAFTRGHTQLGLHFASSVAQLHRNGKRQGFVRLHNGYQLSGGCFELWLP